MLVPENGFWEESTQWLCNPCSDVHTWGGIHYNRVTLLVPKMMMEDAQEESCPCSESRENGLLTRGRNQECNFIFLESKTGGFIFWHSIGSFLFDFLSKHLLVLIPSTFQVRMKLKTGS